MKQLSTRTPRHRSAGLTTAGYRRKVAKVRIQHEEGAGGFTTCVRLTRLTDTLLQETFAHHAPGAPLAVVALGGYGRRELCFGSDIDTMILCKGDEGTAEMRAFFHALLDHGLDVGHSYRTIDDCSGLRHSDIDAWIALLDARFICGDHRVFRDLLARMKHDLIRDDLPSILSRVHALSDQRHAKYGRSTKLLEPNIKNSSGGFRDAQTVLWLLRLTGNTQRSRRDDQPSLRAMMRSPGLVSIFPPSFLRHAGNRLDLLFRIRHQMHLHADGLHDILEFSSQDPIARSLGYRSAGPVSNVERFMREYYEAANTVAELHARTRDWSKDRWLRPRDSHKIKKITKDLQTRGAKIFLSPDAPFSTEVLLKAYHLRFDPALDFSFSLEDTMHRRVTSLTAIRSKRATQVFCSLLTQSAGVGNALRHMNRFGLLARWLPEWRPLVRFFQHNQYHYFTADEHTLTVVEKAEGLRDDTSSFGEAYRTLGRVDVLYFACLFHDITKPRRLDDHEVTGAELSRSILGRLRMDDIADDVSFLVKHHLLMEQIAFRRNLGDPITIREFADRFSRPELLRYLYVLTYADLSAVNTNVLTEWKKSLLTELYTKALAYLGTKGEAAHHDRASDAEDLLASLPPADTDSHASLLKDDAYRRTFSPKEITGHIDALKELDVASTIFHHWSDVTELTLLTNDAPFVLAHVCGAIYANDLTIIDARIFTRDDGIVIDAFRIVDSQTHNPLTEDRCRTLQSDIRDVLTGNCSVHTLLERHRRRWRRRDAARNQNVRTDVVFEEHPHFTIIDVYGADTAGFLYAVSDTISSLGCTIHSAKIATRGDGIVDAFYVRDTDGRPIGTEQRRDEIRGALLARIASSYGSPTSVEQSS